MAQPQSQWVLEKTKLEVDLSQLLHQAIGSGVLIFLVCFILLTLLAMLIGFFKDLSAFFPLKAGQLQGA